MRRSIVTTVILASVCAGQACDRAGAPSSSPPAADASPVEGAWRLTAVTVSGANPSTTVDQAGLFIFGTTHYSMMRIIGGAPRAPFKAANPTAEEKAVAYDTFIANTGAYELAGSTLTIRPMVSKHPNFMGGGFDIFEILREGDTLSLTSKSTNLRFRISDSLVAGSGPAEETRLKLVRVQ